MKITGGGRISSLTGAQAYPAWTSGGSIQRKGTDARRFDTITISGGKVNAFEMELRGRIAQEVRACTTPGRLNALREQVEAGTYEPDAVSTARRMLLLAEEG